MGKTTEFDAASYLDSEDMIAEYLNQALASGDTDLLLSAIGDVAKARGMAQIARDTGLGRESLYKAFAVGAKPRFDTVLKVLRALGVGAIGRRPPSFVVPPPLTVGNIDTPLPFFDGDGLCGWVE